MYNCDVFISCLNSHSDGTHTLQRIHWLANDVMPNFSKSVLKNLHLGWPESEYIFSKFTFLGEDTWDRKQPPRAPYSNCTAIISHPFITVTSYAQENLHFLHENIQIYLVIIQYSHNKFDITVNKEMKSSLSDEILCMSFCLTRYQSTKLCSKLMMLERVYIHTRYSSRGGFTLVKQTRLRFLTPPAA